MTIRLVYGPAPYAGYDGIVVDAEQSERLGRLSRAETVGAAAEVLGCGVEDIADGASADDPFNFETFYMEEGRVVAPADAAWDTLGLLVRHLRRENLDALRNVEEGGGSPGGNLHVISGPIDQLAVLSSLIAAESDELTLERDDALVDLGMARHLYE